jgi:hypothetical protein
MLVVLLLCAAVPSATSTDTATPARSATATPRQWGVIFGSAGVAAAVMLLLGVIAVYVSTRNPLGEYEEIQRMGGPESKC